MQGPPGEPGEPGVPGMDFDSSIRIYGDASDGDLAVGAGEMAAIPAESTFQYASITIATGGTLFIQSGTILRCTGDFDNDGSVQVRPAARSGIRMFGSPSANDAPAGASPHPGVALSSAEFGSVDFSAPFVAYGGLGGEGIGGAARWLTTSLPYAGGGGADSWPFTTRATDSGGGSFHLHVAGAIRSAGSIEADGQAGSLVSSNCGVGGGGGGAVLLAAGMNIDLGGGSVSVRGADGSAGFDQCGAGGGGGGGFVHLIAPSIDAGTIDLAGGAAGAPSSWSSTLRYMGGSGGGGSAGHGGQGEGRSGTTTSAARAGTEGVSFQILADPTTVL